MESIHSVHQKYFSLSLHFVTVQLSPCTDDAIVHFSIYSYVVPSKRTPSKTYASFSNAAARFTCALVDIWSDWRPPKSNKSKLFIESNLRLTNVNSIQIFSLIQCKVIVKSIKIKTFEPYFLNPYYTT